MISFVYLSIAQMDFNSTAEKSPSFRERMRGGIDKFILQKKSIPKARWTSRMARTIYYKRSTQKGKEMERESMNDRP
jgi:hypothetical protein